MRDPAQPTREQIRTQQLAKLRELVGRLRATNAFWAPRLRDAGVDERIESLEAYARRMPLLTKDELVADQQANPPFGTNLTEPVERYTRFSRTSGTTGRPLHWLDTDESWSAMVGVWGEVLRGAGVKAGDRVCFAFSFGPFIGFWLAFEAAVKAGCLCLPGGGLSSTARLVLIDQSGANVLCCTPTYAIRLGQVAAEQHAERARQQIETIIVGGEPGGSVPATRAQIEALWPNARVVDHHGMTEVGPATYTCPDDANRLMLVEPAFYPEVVDPRTLEPLGPGGTGELVLTTLHRGACPVLRYRTGDTVRWSADEVSPCGRSGMQLVGGIIGRSDDMITVRGVNVYPSAVDGIVRGCDGVAEYQVDITRRDGLDELTLLVEPDRSCDDTAAMVERLASRFEVALALRVPVKVVAAGTLPRYEMKAKRWVRR